LERTLTIERRFCGPPDSGNGGYVAGLLAAELGGSDCEVMLRAPPPLDTALQLRREDEALCLLDGARLIASATPASVDMLVPPAPSQRDAEDASSRFAGFRAHPFPGCFVCGPDRGAGDGLRIFPGASTGRRVAATWVPSPDLCGDDGRIRVEFIWAALDCPGYFAVCHDGAPALLGKIAVHVAEPVDCSEPLIVAGWPVDSSGRKHRAATALYRGEQPVAWAMATWLTLAA
jgi:hypothetical protein